MDKLENLLSNRGSERPHFVEGFTDSVMQAVMAVQVQGSNLIRLWERRMWVALAACFALALVSVYVLDGSLSFDSVLGLSGHSATEIGESIDTYNQWDLELAQP